MSFRARLQGLLLGAATAGVCMANLSRDMWEASAKLGDAVQAKGLGFPKAKAVVKPAALQTFDTPDWSVETKVDAIRTWNEHVREWHRCVAKKLFA